MTFEMILIVLGAAIVVCALVFGILVLIGGAEMDEEKEADRIYYNEMAKRKGRP